MSHPNKRKGSTYEAQVVESLREVFPHAERRVQGGAQDKGDVAGIYNDKGSWVIEAKNVQRIELATFVDEAKREAANAKADYYAAVIKRRNKSVDESYVVMPLSQFKQLIA